MTETGMATLVIVVARESLRNPYRTMIAMMPPRIAAFLTSSTADEMNRDWS